MIVLDNGRDKGTVVAVGGRIEAMISFHEPPPVVLPTRARCQLVIDFLPTVLTHVSDIEVPGKSVGILCSHLP
jgi:hypothetical protein